VLVGGTGYFFLCEKMSKKGECKWIGDSHAKVDNENVTVGGYSRVCQVGEGRRGERGEAEVPEVSGRFRGGEDS